MTQALVRYIRSFTGFGRDARRFLITTIVFGCFAAIMPAFLPVDKLAQLVNIGTLLAFTIVC